MGGIPIVGVGFEVAQDALQRYYKSHSLPETGLAGIKYLLSDLETQCDNTAVSLVRADDNDGTNTRVFVCSYVGKRDRIYGCEELIKKNVPAGFVQSVQGTLGVSVKHPQHFFAPNARVYSYDFKERN